MTLLRGASVVLLIYAAILNDAEASLWTILHVSALAVLFFVASLHKGKE